MTKMLEPLAKHQLEVQAVKNEADETMEPFEPSYIAILRRIDLYKNLDREQLQEAYVIAVASRDQPGMVAIFMFDRPLEPIESALERASLLVPLEMRSYLYA